MGPRPCLCVDAASSMLSGEWPAGPSLEVACEALWYRCSPQVAQPGGKNNQLGASVSFHIKSKFPQISTTRPLPCEWVWSAHIRAFLLCTHQQCTEELFSPQANISPSLQVAAVCSARFGSQCKYHFFTAGLAVVAERCP